MKPISLIRHSIVVFGLLFLRPTAQAQSGASPKAYTYLIYHKLSPGLTIQDALPVEKEWRAINQAAVDEGNMIGWYMLAKQMSSNTNPTEYDYVTVIVTPSMGIKGASAAGMSKIYGDSVKTRMADLQKRDRATAPVVKMEIWETVDAVFNPGFTPAKTPLVVIDFMRLRDPASDWSSLVGSMKRQATERIQANTIAGWDLSSLVVPSGSEKGYSLISAQSMASMDALANRNATTAGASAEVAKLRTQHTRTFDIVRQEVFRIMEFTAKQPVGQATK